MTLFNLMLGSGRGGIEQAAYDYHEALTQSRMKVQSILHPRGAMADYFTQQQATFSPLASRGNWDILAVCRLARLIKQHAPEAIICHGNRALSLALKAARGRCAVIAVAHNYKIQKRFPKADAVFCITRDLMEECVHLEIPRRKLFYMPNMTRLPAQSAQRSAFRRPVRIGTMGRFVEKKGIDILLQALGALQADGIAFQARIGGGGALESALREQTQRLGIAPQCEFVGWVANKQAFFESLDIFVLPSRHEPFGIVLIEAMAAGLPVITTDTEGPCEIITQHRDAMMIEKDRPFQLAAALRELIDDEPRALQMGIAARQTIAAQYDLPVFAQRLKIALTSLHN